MAKLTKTLRACLIDAAIFPLTITACHDDMPTKAQAASGQTYGRHTLHTAISNGWIECQMNELMLTQDGLKVLSPHAAYTIAATRCLNASLNSMK